MQLFKMKIMNNCSITFGPLIFYNAKLDFNCETKLFVYNVKFVKIINECVINIPFNSF